MDCLDLDRFLFPSISSRKSLEGGLWALLLLPFPCPLVLVIEHGFRGCWLCTYGWALGPGLLGFSKVPQHYPSLGRFAFWTGTWDPDLI